MSASTVNIRYIVINNTDDSSTLLEAIAPYCISSTIIQESPLYLLDSTYSMVANIHTILAIYDPSQETNIMSALADNIQAQSDNGTPYSILPVPTWVHESVSYGY